MSDVQSIPANVNLEIVKGTLFELYVNLIDRVDGLAVDLSDTVVTAGIKRLYADPVVTQAFSTSIPTPASGQAYIFLPSIDTAALTLNSGVYEVLATTTTTAGGNTNTKQVKLLTGNVQVI